MQSLLIDLFNQLNKAGKETPPICSKMKLQIDTGLNSNTISRNPKKVFLTNNIM